METKDRTVTVAIITGVVTLLLGCCLGALVGGLGGFAIGRQTEQRAFIEYTPDVPQMPETPALPDTPAMPVPQFPRLRGIGGALLREVVADSPAQKAGLKIGDVITAVDGVPLDENHRLADIIGQYQPGDKITLEVLRMGKTVTLKATLGENPDSNGQPYLGVRYTDLAPGAEPGPDD